jgi:Uma2 family endonuclease
MSIPADLKPAALLSAPPIETAQQVILHGIRWETYERLLAEHEESRSIHFAYDQGALEIMVLSPRHEAIKHLLALLVEVLAEEMGIDVYGFGSTTFRRRDLQRGFEPDACFYIRQEARVRGKTEIDLAVDPAPDLVIEIDISHPSLDKFPIFAALGVAEIWRYDGSEVAILALSAGSYTKRAESTMLPGVTGRQLTDWLETGQRLRRTEWLRRVRTWARTSR